MDSSYSEDAPMATAGAATQARCRIAVRVNVVSPSAPVSACADRPACFMLSSS